MTFKNMRHKLNPFSEKGKNRDVLKALQLLQENLDHIQVSETLRESLRQATITPSACISDEKAEIAVMHRNYLAVVELSKGLDRADLNIITRKRVERALVTVLTAIMTDHILIGPTIGFHHAMLLNVEENSPFEEIELTAAIKNSLRDMDFEDELKIHLESCDTIEEIERKLLDAVTNANKDSHCWAIGEAFQLIHYGLEIKARSLNGNSKCKEFVQVKYEEVELNGSPSFDQLTLNDSIALLSRRLAVCGQEAAAQKVSCVSLYGGPKSSKYFKHTTLPIMSIDMLDNLVNPISLNIFTCKVLIRTMCPIKTAIDDEYMFFVRIDHEDRLAKMKQELSLQASRTLGEESLRAKTVKRYMDQQHKSNINYGCVLTSAWNSELENMNILSEPFAHLSDIFTIETRNEFWKSYNMDPNKNEGNYFKCWEWSSSWLMLQYGCTLERQISSSVDRRINPLALLKQELNSAGASELSKDLMEVDMIPLSQLEEHSKFYIGDYKALRNLGLRRLAKLTDDLSIANIKLDKIKAASEMLSWDIARNKQMLMGPNLFFRLAEVKRIMADPVPIKQWLECKKSNSTKITEYKEIGDQVNLLRTLIDVKINKEVDSRGMGQPRSISHLGRHLEASKELMSGDALFLVRYAESELKSNAEKQQAEEKRVAEAMKLAEDRAEKAKVAKISRLEAKEKMKHKFGF